MDITVDGSEIRRSPDEVGSLIPLFSTGFQHHQRGGFLARFLPSTVFCIFSHICPKKSSRRIPKLRFSGCLDVLGMFLRSRVIPPQFRCLED